MTIELQTGKVVKATKRDLDEAYRALKNNEAFEIHNHQRGYSIIAEQHEIDNEIEWNGSCAELHNMIMDGIWGIYEL